MQGATTFSPILGSNASFAEVVQSHAGLIENYVEALRFPLSQVGHKPFAAKSCRTDREGFRELWAHLGATLNLAAMYNLLERLWNECLWRGWFVERDDVDRVVQLDTEQERFTTAGYHRWHLLQSEAFLHMQSLRGSIWQERAPNRLFTIRKDGKRQRVLPRKPSPEDDRLRQAYDNFFVQEPYFFGLMQEELPKTAGLTLDDLMRARLILSSLAQDIRDRLPAGAEFGSGAELKRYAPLYRTKDLVQVIARSLTITVKKAADILTFFTSTRSHREDLWTRPIVPINAEKVTLLLPSMLTPNLVRDVTAWMKQGGLDLEQRGEPFEQHVRTEASLQLEIDGAAARNKDCLFEVGDEYEQIDWIVVIGNRVLIGESRCLVFPTAAYDLHIAFQQELPRKAKQARRKAEFAERHKEAFLAFIGAEHVPADRVQFVPCVITNIPVFSGSDLDGVPVIDLPILMTYLGSGRLPVLSRIDPDGSIHVEQTLQLFSTADEAASGLADYLRKPPQVRRYVDALVWRDSPPYLIDEELGIPFVMRQMWVDHPIFQSPEGQDGRR